MANTTKTQWYVCAVIQTRKAKVAAAMPLSVLGDYYVVAGMPEVCDARIFRREKEAQEYADKINAEAKAQGLPHDTLWRTQARFYAEFTLIMRGIRKEA